MTLRITLAILCLLLTPLATAGENEEEKGLFKAKPIYVSMLPHFLVNLDDRQTQRFMQIKANTLVANKNTEKSLKLHMPAVRHGILMMLSHLTPDDVRTSEQKEALRQEITEIIRVTLRELSDHDDVKGFYITSVVTQ